MYARVTLKNVKCHPKFNLVEGFFVIHSNFPTIVSKWKRLSFDIVPWSSSTYSGHVDQLRSIHTVDADATQLSSWVASEFWLVLWCVSNSQLAHDDWVWSTTWKLIHDFVNNYVIMSSIVTNINSLHQAIHLRHLLTTETLIIL